MSTRLRVCTVSPLCVVSLLFHCHFHRSKFHLPKCVHQSYHLKLVLVLCYLQLSSYLSKPFLCLAIGIKLLGPVWVCLKQSHVYSELRLILHFGVMKPYFFMYNELCLNYWNNAYCWVLILRTTATASSQQTVFMWSDWSGKKVKLCLCLTKHHAMKM